MVLQDRCLTNQGPLWSYKTGVLQCRGHCGVIRLVVYEYMGLIIHERVKLTFSSRFCSFFVLPLCVFQSLAF